MTELQKKFTKILASLRKKLNLAEEDIVGIVVMCCTEEAMIEMVEYIKQELMQDTLTRNKFVAKVHDIIEGE